MAKSKADERTFTAELYLDRTRVDGQDRYQLIDVGLPVERASMMHRTFRGIAKCFRRPRRERFSANPVLGGRAPWRTRRRVRVTFEVLPEEETK